MKRRRFIALIASSFALVPLTRAEGASVTWTGANGANWNNASWSAIGGPGTSDTAVFNDAGSTNLPNEVTSFFDTNDRTIGGLTFNNTLGKYHTLDLGTRTLNVTGNLNFNSDQSQTTTSTVRNGVLNVSGAFANVNVGRAVSLGSTANADLSGLTSFTFNSPNQNMLVGVASAAVNATGVLTLPSTNSITASLIQVGASAPTSGQGDGTLKFGLSNIVQANQFVIAQDFASGTVSVRAGGTLNLGSAAARTSLSIANSTTNTNTTYTGKLDLAGATFNAFLSDVIVGQRQGGAGGSTIALVTAPSGGTVNIGAAGNTANFFVGNMLTGGASATGTADFSGLSSLTASLNNFSMGVALSGSAQGVVKLAASNTISANKITVGSSGDGANALTLGMSNTIAANQLVVAQDFSSGTVTLPAGGTLNLGSAGARTSVAISNFSGNTNTTYTGKLDLASGTLNAYLSDFIVAQRQGGGGGTAIGVVTAATGGTINIGAAGNSANFLVGNALSGGAGANGSVDFSACRR